MRNTGFNETKISPLSRSARPRSRKGEGVLVLDVNGLWTEPCHFDRAVLQKGEYGPPAQFADDSLHYDGYGGHPPESAGAGSCYFVWRESTLG